MIICPKCETELMPASTGYKCGACSYQADTNDGITVFNPEIKEDFTAYDPAVFDIFRDYEEEHFWFRTRRRIIRDIFQKWVKKEEKVIEIGIGNGSIARALLLEGYSDLSIGDAHQKVLRRFNEKKIKGKHQFDVSKAPFQDHFDAIGMFDVLEHIEDDQMTLKKVHGMLKHGGRLIITVPAHQWLWSKYDLTHKRRYEVKSLKESLEKNGFDVMVAKNFFVFIVPLLFLRSLLGKNAAKSSSEELAREQIKISPAANKMLYWLSRLENRLLKNFSPTVGGSIIVVAKKKI